MRNVLRAWQYRDDNNCWDFVRLVLTQEFNVPDLPKFGIAPTDKRGMTKAYHGVRQGFIEISTPVDGAVACHYRGKVLIHVGVIINGEVWHVGRKHGQRIDSIKDFQSITTTRFYQWHGSSSKTNSITS